MCLLVSSLVCVADIASNLLTLNDVFYSDKCFFEFLAGFFMSKILSGGIIENFIVWLKCVDIVRLDSDFAVTKADQDIKSAVHNLGLLSTQRRIVVFHRLSSSSSSSSSLSLCL